MTTTPAEAFVTGSLVGLLARPEIGALLPNCRYSTEVDEHGVIQPLVNLINQTTGKVWVQILVTEVTP